LFCRYVNTILTVFFHVFLLNAHLIYKTGLYTMTQQSPVGQVLLIIKDSRSHSDNLTSVGFLCTGDQPDAETSTWQHTTLTRDRFPCHRWDSNQQSQQASSRRPTT